MDDDAPRAERFAAFGDDADGGNPAGVVLDAAGLTAGRMQQLAAAVGYSETAFVTGPIRRAARSVIPIRYFAPEGEVDFCGHATIATAVALCESVGEGSYTLGTRVGPVAVTGHREGARTVGSLRSPAVGCLPLERELLEALLDALRWHQDDLDPSYPPAIGVGGNRHPVLVARDLRRLERLDYDFPTLQRLSREHGWITVQLVTPAGPGQWRARNPFPWGGVVEDPATGAAAAAFAGYLRHHGRLEVGDGIVIRQGVELGRPGTIAVQLLEDAALVSGTATRIRRHGEA
ncbi:PhzF family phenazine biosynthesis isomerase [Terrabacter sp. NPDC080008]|uniref:PhzF family phenazine biosynthesis protein n=1 Tax=Terrabacter sp. NPDC080008 TaxID=3155176 RepID=UPI00344CE994